MRTWQHVGLKPEACKWLMSQVQRTPEKRCDKCNSLLEGGNTISKVYDSPEIWYGQELELHEYKLTDGSICREVIQAEPWSGGPVTFLCLELDGKKIFKWPKVAIDNC